MAKAHKNRSNVWLEPAPLLLVAGLVLVAPLFRGLFFPGEQMMAFFAAMALAILMALAGYYRLGGLNPLDASLLGLIGAFILSAFGSVSPRAAVQFLITQITFLTLYWAVSRLGHREGNRRWIIEILALAPLLLALIGLGAAIGWIKYPSAVEGNRISSTLQYYNSLAAYLTAGVVFALALRVRVDLPVWRRTYYSLVAFFSLVTIIFTYSRGGWLVVPPVLLIFLALVPSPRRQIVVLASLAPVIGALGAAWLFEPGFKAKSELMMASGLMLGTGLTIALDRLADWVHQRTAGRERTVWAAIGAAALAGLAVAYAKLPPEVLVRISKINFMDMSVQERLSFYRDALKIIADYPVLGIGGNGWASVFMNYQSYGYYSTQVHSWLMQVWVEGGSLALLALLAAVGSFIAMYFRIRRQLDPVSDGNLILTGAAVGAGAIFLHSLIDFNLSLAGLTIFLTGLIALTRSFENKTERARPQTEIGLFEAAIIGLAIGATLANTALISGFRHGQAGLEHIKNRRYQEARREFGLATRYDPLQATYWMDYGNSTMTVGNSEKNPVLVREGWGYSLKALSLDPFDPKLRRAAGTGALSNGLVEEGLREMEAALKLNPLTLARYEEMGQTLFLAGDWYLKRGQKDLARQKFEQALAIPAKMKETSASVNAPWAGTDQKLPFESEAMNLIVSKSLVMLGKVQEAESLLAPIKSPNLVDEANVWLALSLERQGREPEARRILESVFRRRPNFQQLYDQVKPRLKELSWR